jgi:hypothetical protein
MHYPPDDIVLFDERPARFQLFIASVAAGFPGEDVHRLSGWRPIEKTFQ